ncbi:MAG: DNA topoisomerase I [Acidilobaceae archaeon]
MNELEKGRCRPPVNFIAVIAEKPKAAERIAKAIGQASLCVDKGVRYWIVKTSSKPVVVVSAAGHLFGIRASQEGYPVYSFQWMPLWTIDENYRHQKKLYDLLAKLLPKASSYVGACDYDIEGSVICYKIIEAFGDLKRAFRMKFSTLTVTELKEAFKKLQPLDIEMVEAGLARHELDWLWGINTSRALMDSLRSVVNYKKSLSAGRVQSPTLLEAVRRWLSRSLHVPIPSVSITVEAETANGHVVYFKPLGWSPQSLSEARSIEAELKRYNTLFVTDLKKQERTVLPPPPFNLGDLQHEAYRLFGFSPKKTEEIAEELYLGALISYPRTNSQKLPSTINFHQIMNGLKSNPDYKSLVDRLLRETRGVLRPVQGKAEDPAHPAIHPTGEQPEKLTREQKLIYDLIVRRFLAAFAKPAVLSEVEIVVKDNFNRPYVAHGVEIVEKGWYNYYHFEEPHVVRLPEVRKNDRLRVVKTSVKIRWSGPTESLTKDSLLRWMESEELGTESTRARIIEVLYERGYLASRGRSTIVTDLGMAVALILNEHVPELTSPELTRKFEKLLEDIRNNKTTRAQVTREAIAALNLILKKISDNKHSIGLKLAQAANLIKPKDKCEVCERQASTFFGGTKLCEYHKMAAEELSKKLPEVAQRLSTTCRKALEDMGKKRTVGTWVLDVVRLALKKPTLLEALISQSCRQDSFKAP